MSDLVNRLRRQLTMSMFATKDDLYGQLHDERGQAADRLDQLERVLAQAREALEDPAIDAVTQLAGEYHEAFKGYRPERHKAMDDDVKKVKDAIAAIDEALNTEAQGRR